MCIRSGFWQFWIDRGGTFTDLVARRPDGTILTHKLLSSHPERYRDAALQGIRELLNWPADCPLASRRFRCSAATIWPAIPCAASARRAVSMPAGWPNGWGWNGFFCIPWPGGLVGLRHGAGRLPAGAGTGGGGTPGNFPAGPIGRDAGRVGRQGRDELRAQQVPDGRMLALRRLALRYEGTTDTVFAVAADDGARCAPYEATKLVVALVQADGGFVQHVHDPYQPGPDLTPRPSHSGQANWGRGPPLSKSRGRMIRIRGGARIPLAFRWGSGRVAPIDPGRPLPANPPDLPPRWSGSGCRRNRQEQ